MYAEHPAIDTPPDDAIIWRYMDIPKLLVLLGSGRLHLCRLDRLRDPFEGEWPESVVDALKSEAERHPGVTLDMLLRPSKLMRTCFYVSCWHESPWESAALWGQYGNSGGIAIRSTIGRLKRACNTDQQYFVGRVRYLDYSQSDAVVNARNAFVPAFLKRSSFEHEREVRVLVDGTPLDDIKCIVDWSSVKEYQELPAVLEELIESVWISPECPLWQVEPVKQLLHKFGLDVPVERSPLYDPAIR
jgi:hypothetical protein